MLSASELSIILANDNAIGIGIGIGFLHMTPGFIGLSIFLVDYI